MPVPLTLPSPPEYRGRGCGNVNMTVSVPIQSISPYFFIFLYRVTRLTPSAAAVRARL